MNENEEPIMVPATVGNALLFARAAVVLAPVNAGLARGLATDAYRLWRASRGDNDG